MLVRNFTNFLQIIKNKRIKAEKLTNIGQFKEKALTYKNFYLRI